MSRTSMALKRLGVAALATATIGAGVPAFFAATSASAATGDVVTLTPDTDSASTGTCNIFTIEVTNGGKPATATVDVVVTERDTSLTETADVTFCTTSATNAAPNVTTATSPDVDADTTNDTGGAAAGQQDTDQAEFTTDANGKITFGITSDKPQVVDVRAFIEDDNNDVYNQGEITDAPSQKTFTQGGDDSVTVLDAEPENATGFTNNPVTYTVTAKNASGDTVSGADVYGVVTSKPSAAAVASISCVDAGGVQTGGNAAVGTTNNNGQTTCTLTADTAGEYTVIFFADQTGRQSGVIDTNEAQDEVKASIAAAPTNLVVDLTCASPSPTSFENCENPLNANTEQFTATVTAPDSADAGTERDVANNVLVNFAVTSDPGTTTGTNPTADDNDATLSAASCRTDATGKCTVTLTEPVPTEGEAVQVTATVAGQTTANTGCTEAFTNSSICNTDTATKTFRTATASEARSIDLTPEAGTLTAGNQQLSAKVVDEFGNPVAGVTVSFNATGATFTNDTNSASAVTNAAGVATATLKAPASGSATVTASIAGGAASECDDAAVAATPGVGPGSTGACTDSEAYTFAPAGGSPSPSQSSAPGCSTALSNLPVRFNAPTARVSRTGATGPVVNATALVTVTVTGATPNGVVELQAYQQNHFGTANFANAGNTRTATANASGVATFQVRFSSNARARAKMQGCAFGANAGFNQGSSGAASNVLYVRTVLTFTVTRTGTRTIRIVGDSLPARPGGLIVNIHCTDARCKSASNPNGILFQPRANAVTGEFGPVSYTFAAAFQNNRVVLYAATGRQDTGEGDAQNVAGRSNNRSVLIY